MKSYIIVVLTFCYSFSHGQSLNRNWEQALSNELKQFIACENANTHGVNSCNDLIGKSVATVYNVNDFYSKNANRYMLVSEISEFLEENNRWKRLGHAYEQEALNEAQNYANARKAAVAVYLNEEGIGHVSLILPGELSPSGSWGFKVPNSASFFSSTPEKSYIDKGLSYAFERSHIKQVVLYGRSY